MRAAILSRRCCGDARVCALLRKLCEQGHPIGHTVVRHSRGLGIARSRRRRPAARRRPSPRRSNWPGRAPPRGPPVRRRCSRGRSARRLEGEVEARQVLMVESRTIAAPTARRICVQRRKKTFATLSLNNGQAVRSTLAKLTRHHDLILLPICSLNLRLTGRDPQRPLHYLEVHRRRTRALLLTALMARLCSLRIQPMPR